MLLKNTMNDIAENSEEFRNSSRDSTSERKMSRQIQGIKTSTLHTHIAVKSSPDIPCEITERILFFLDACSILKCKLVNREFNNLIQTSTLLQYFLACKVAGVIDNPRSSLSYGERLKALKKREDVWKTLKPLFEKRIKINNLSNGTYGLMGGTFFLDDINEKDLHYCRLPSSPQDHFEWGKVSCLAPGEGQIFVAFTGAVYEHDLIINFISTDTGTEYSYDLVLLKFSTGEYHPLAYHPRIPLQKSYDVNPEISVLQVAGDNLALVISNAVTDSDLYSLFIFDWKTGHNRLRHTTENQYSDLVFVSPELLLVTNPILAHLEVWYIPPSYSNLSPVVQILALKIPALSPDYFLLNINFHGEPSPFLHSLPFSPPRPFFSCPEDSIIVTNLLFSLPGYGNLCYAFIMHRRALLDTIQKWASLSLLQQSADQSIWLTNKATVNQKSDSHSGSVRLGTQSKSTSVMPRQRSFPLPYGFPIFAPFQSSTSYISTDPGSLSISSRSSITLLSFRYDFAQVKWADWGPPISRWFRLASNQAQWAMNSTGQRFAFSFRNPQDERKLMVSVADFNQYNVRRNANTITQLQGGGEDNSSNWNIIDGRKEEEPERFDHGGVFDEEVQMGLKCVIYQAPDEYDFDRVSMDEERILGVKCKDDEGYEYIQVLYFG